MIPLLLSFISGISTLLGSVFIFIKIRRVEEFNTFFLSLSMTIMVLISIFDLLPNSIIKLINNYKIFYGLILISLTFILGYLTIYVIEKKINSDSNLYKIGILSFISLIIHNFPEGIAVFISAYNNIHIGYKMCIAIMLHNIPEGISISLPLYYSGIKKRRVVLLTLISGLSEPIGALLSYFFLKEYINELLLSFILIFVSGLMISLSINEIYKEIKYNNKKYIFSGILTSILILILLFLIN